MKELSIEEKAQRYDETLEKATALYKVSEPMSGCNVIIETLFPELKESEDEKIRKELLEHCKNQAEPYIQSGNKCPQIQSWIAWLEKQGEQNHIEPKFRVGDEIKTSNEESLTVTKIDEKGYWSEDLFICGFDDAAKWELVEQKPARSEEDNNMLKWVIGYLNNRMLNTPISEERAACKNAIAWLEKLKDEKKPAGKVEPRFKVGDWVVSPNGVYWHIDAIQDGRYEVTADTGQCADWPLDTNIYRLWTIQDAKDGDVLVNWNNTAFIFKAIEDETVKFHIAYNEKWDAIKTPSTKLSHLGLPEPQFEFHPATKEQRDTLFAEMKDAGYEWDTEKKELKKIKQKSTDNANKVEPRFKVGDIIRLKNGDGLEWTVEEIFNDEYYTIVCDDRDSFILLDDNWELVEQKSANKIEPKFKVGDWIVKNDGKDCFSDGSYVLQITNVDDIKYNLSNGCFLREPFIDTYRLWAIQDAKDGDVLAGHETIVLFKKIEGQNIRCYCTYHFMNNPHFYVDTLQSKNPYCPAKKEQCDLLFQKMKEAGYEWNAEKKELKKIEQKPVWNEEDDIMVHDIDYALRCQIIYPKYKLSRISSWIDSLKDRIQPQSKQEWSEEDEKVIHCLEYTVRHFYEDEDTIRWSCDWLNSIRDRIQPQPKQEWSEEDRDYYDAIIAKLEVTQDDALLTDNQMRFLKSLIPQNRWKPSDKQMEVLWKYAEQNNYDGFILTSLHEQLKKLREE